MILTLNLGRDRDLGLDAPDPAALRAGLGAGFLLIAQFSAFERMEVRVGLGPRVRVQGYLPLAVLEVPVPQFPRHGPEAAVSLTGRPRRS